jgi:hypothetical protein
VRRADQGGGAIRRACRSCFALLGALLAAFAVAGTASAESLPAPPGFSVRASNGFSLKVIGLRNSKTGESGLIAFVSGRNSSVVYSTQDAVVTDTSIKADLGEVGRIDVDFVPSGKPRTERAECGGKRFTFDSGHYDGVIDFEGEHGYSQAHVKSARGEARLLLSIVCAEPTGSEGRGGHSPGARLTARTKGRTPFEFVAMKNSPSRPTRLAASLEEKRGTVEIARAVGITAPPGAFAFDVPSGTATVDPPAPFAGRAVYHRRRGGSSTWRGDLSVDFPGRPNVGLTGGSARASLERAVLNPGHPF